MPNEVPGQNQQGEIPRRVPAIITYLQPFRIVENPKSDKWSISIEQVNNHDWDYVKLHELAGGVDVELPAPYHMLVGRDGALALPPIPQLRSDQQAVEFFNRCLAALLLGGVYCTAVDLDNLELGSVIDWKYIRSNQGQAKANNFHKLIRMQMAPPIDAIALMNPRILDFDNLLQAASKGFKLLKLASSISPEFLLKGVSGIARRDWGVGLSNLWIVIEQLTEILWQREILQPLKVDPNQLSGRSAQLRDTRTWTAANRQELLHQKGLISPDTLSNLYQARKARNDLSHRGSHPTELSANSAYRAVLALLQTVVGEVTIPLLELDLTDHSLSDPFRPVGSRELNPSYWMDIPKLPGEVEIEHEEAQIRKSEAPSHEENKLEETEPETK